MRNIARLLSLSLVAAGAITALAAARPADAARGGVIKVRIAIASPAGRPVDAQVSIADGAFADGDRDVRIRTLRGDGSVAFVAELTHTGRVTITSRAGPVRAVATYASAPPGARVTEAQWRSLSVAHSGTRIEMQRAGSFVAVVPADAGPRVAQEH